MTPGFGLSQCLRHRLVLVFAACVLPRLAALWMWRDPPPTYYWEISDSLLATGVFGFGGEPTTSIEPLYPVFLAAARLVAADSPAATLVMAYAGIGLDGLVRRSRQDA